jgi:glycosyltransferase involved in cell wall biosynthesis
MPVEKVICIISNSHRTNDVRIYHKLAKSLCKIANVYVLGARGVGSMMENYSEDKDALESDSTLSKPTRIIVSGLTPNLRLFGLYRQAVKLKPDLVICIEPLTMIVGLYIQKKTGCKLCYDAHEYYTAAHSERHSFPMNYISGGIYYLVEHILQEKMDLTIAVNQDIFKLFNLTPIDPSKKTEPTAINLMDKYLRPLNSLGVLCPNYPTSDIWNENISISGTGSLLPDTGFDVIYLGGITEERGIIKILQVIDILRHKHSQFKGLFIGPFYSEDFKKKFYNYIMDNNLNSHVYWRDAVPHDKVYAILRQVKVGLSVLHPGYKRYKKALPLKVLEYLSAGIPVVANDFPQLKDIIEKNGVGTCVPFHRSDIANAIEKFLTISPTERDKLSLKCRKVVQQQYMWSKVEPVLLEAVNYVLNPLKQ